MASESTEEDALTVHLPSDLGTWLDEQAADMGVDRETVLVQVLAAYRATSELDGDVDADEVGIDVPTGEEVETLVDSRLDALLDDRLESEMEQRLGAAVDGRVEEAVDAALDERLPEATNAVQDRIDTLEADVRAKIEDVRERVIQVKKEADAKAPADHDHEEFEQLPALGKRVDDLAAEVNALEGRLDDALPAQEERVEELSDQLDTVEERLQTVAWAVRDLRDSYESDTGLETVDRIKRAAAKADVDRAKCESCGNGVEIALLTDPNCPHCDATVTDVEEAASFFSKPRLLVASQLESGEKP